MGGGAGGGHGHSAPTLGPIDGAHDKVFAEHPQGGGHAPRYRPVRLENHERSVFRFGAVTAVSEAEQARWLGRMMDNPYYPKDTVIHFVHNRQPMVTTPNQLRAHVGYSKAAGNGHLHKLGIKPWYMENLFRVTFVNYAAAAFVGACCAIALFRPQWRMVKRMLNKRYGWELPVEGEYTFHKGSYNLQKPVA
eukprot:TRINITY_DN25971_c0_g1_i1.p2 TRINITY_DN25971_c0_g1~~TRINITY_DN25971_c0_g1_i1.p2  ORF type:complete len:192 (+),score=19.68 TRINITY_DN25971_c0_g1_i1:72-647(+)